MKYVILGGVAAGTKAAAKLKRCDRNAEVKVFTKGEDISYAGCGFPTTSAEISRPETNLSSTRRRNNPD